MKRMTADEHRAAAQAADQAAYDSFERCDTDGFLSQWASGLNAQKHRLQAEIEDNGGKWEFPALFDLDGNLVPAKLISTRYGMSWALLDPANPEGSFLGFFNDSQALAPCMSAPSASRLWPTCTGPTPAPSPSTPAAPMAASRPTPRSSPPSPTTTKRTTDHERTRSHPRRRRGARLDHQRTRHLLRVRPAGPAHRRRVQ